jgi:uncharacterized membrane protein YphA (DoxX/SURF4 family)
MPTSRSRTIAYWITTVLFCFPMAAGGVFDLMQPPDVTAIFDHLGYPHYVATIIGVGKVLGVLALLAPGFPRLKEWAYAGFTIDLVGASASHVFVGDKVGDIATPIVILAVGLASYFLRPESRRLPDPPK